MIFRIKEEGLIHSERSFVLPARWDPEKVEFIVADANALPFRSGSFSCVASLNLIDKIAHPLGHIAEASRGGEHPECPVAHIRPVFVVRGGMRSRQWLGGVRRRQDLPGPG